jgi:hypothetical protein
MYSQYSAQLNELLQQLFDWFQLAIPVHLLEQKHFVMTNNGPKYLLGPVYLEKSDQAHLLHIYSDKSNPKTNNNSYTSLILYNATKAYHWATDSIYWMRPSANIMPKVQRMYLTDPPQGSILPIDTHEYPEETRLQDAMLHHIQLAPDKAPHWFMKLCRYLQVYVWSQSKSQQLVHVEDLFIRQGVLGELVSLRFKSFCYVCNLPSHFGKLIWRPVEDTPSVTLGTYLPVLAFMTSLWQPAFDNIDSMKRLRTPYVNLFDPSTTPPKELDACPVDCIYFDYLYRSLSPPTVGKINMNPLCDHITIDLCANESDLTPMLINRMASDNMHHLRLLVKLCRPITRSDVWTQWIDTLKRFRHPHVTFECLVQTVDTLNFIQKYFELSFVQFEVTMAATIKQPTNQGDHVKFYIQ